MPPRANARIDGTGEFPVLDQPDRLARKIREHRVAGGSDIKAQERPEVAVACTSCHEAGGVHRGAEAALLAKHTVRIACQTSRGREGLHTTGSTQRPTR